MALVSKLEKALAHVTVLALVVTGIVALAGRLLASPPSRVDDVFRLEFVVLDDETSLRVKGAAVRLIDPFGYESDDGDKPRDDDDGEFALGEGQEKMAVAGRPEVPEEWSQYLLKARVRGEVIELLADSKAQVNVGRKQGLRVGMALVPTEEEYIRMEIVRVDEQDSVVRTEYGFGADRKIRVGDIVSTRRPPPRVTIQKNP